jgi:hypothetical protein
MSVTCAGPPTQLRRPPHPALVCVLASTLHPPLLLCHISSPSPTFLCHFLSPPNCSRAVPTGECQAFCPDCGEVCQRGGACRLRRVRGPRTTTAGACSHLRRNDDLHSLFHNPGRLLSHTRRSLPHYHRVRHGGPVECARQDLGRRVRLQRW